MPRRKDYLVAIGGANMDVKCRTAGVPRMGTSNPGSASLAPGGVARNVAQNLAQLGLDAKLVALVGRDAPGDRLLAATAAAGVDIRHVGRGGQPTGSYVATLDAAGELVLGVAAMDVLEELTPALLRRDEKLFAGAALIVADGNLPAESLEWLAGFAAANTVRLAAVAASVPKMKRLAALLAARRPLFALFANREEAEALLRRPLASVRALGEAARGLHRRGVQHVAISLGRRGMFIAGEGSAGRVVAPPRAAAIDVTGAGDAAVAGTLYGLLAGRSAVEAAAYGQAAAALTIASDGSVSPALNARLLANRVRACYGALQVAHG